MRQDGDQKILKIIAVILWKKNTIMGWLEKVSQVTSMMSRDWRRGGNTTHGKWGKNELGRGNHQCKDPEVGLFWRQQKG